MAKKYLSAIDMSGPYCSWAITTGYGNDILDSFSINLKGKNNSDFFNLFFSRLEKLKIELNEIIVWYLGVGPGSFTGLRIAFSFISGITFENENAIVIRIPSVMPIAAKIHPKSGEKVAVLSPGISNSILICGVSNNNGKLFFSKPISVKSDRLAELVKEYDYLTTLSKASLSSIVPDNIMQEITQMERFPIELMFENKYEAIDYDYENSSDLYSDSKHKHQTS